MDPIAARCVIVRAELKITRDGQTYTIGTYFGTAVYITSTILITSGHLISPPYTLNRNESITSIKIHVGIMNMPSQAVQALEEIVARGTEANIIHHGHSRMTNRVEPDFLLLQIGSSRTSTDLPPVTFIWEKPKKKPNKVDVYGFPSFEFDFLEKHESVLGMNQDELVDFGREMKQKHPPTNIVKSEGPLHIMDDKILEYGCSTTPGFSGGPVTFEKDGVKNVVGVHWGCTTLDGLDTFTEDDLPQGTPMWHPAIISAFRQVLDPSSIQTLGIPPATATASTSGRQHRSDENKKPTSQ